MAEAPNLENHPGPVPVHGTTQRDLGTTNRYTGVGTPADLLLLCEDLHALRAGVAHVASFFRKFDRTREGCSELLNTEQARPILINWVSLLCTPLTLEGWWAAFEDHHFRESLVIGIIMRVFRERVFSEHFFSAPPAFKHELWRIWDENRGSDSKNLIDDLAHC